MLLQPDAILAAWREIGYTAWRDRVLAPVTTMPRFRWHILPGHTACRHLPHLSGIRFTAAAYGQAHTRLPVRCLDRLLERFRSAVPQSGSDDERWLGHRPCLVDGSGCSMPDASALQDAFGHSTEQRPGCGFPVAHLLGLFHAGTGVLLKLVVAPLVTHDLALLVQAGVPAVLRVGARQIVDFTPGRPFVRPSVRRTPAVKGVPRSRWLKRSASTTNSWPG